MSTPPQGRPPPRPIQRLLVANRGEIATRILLAALELNPPVETFALSSANDDSHTLHATNTIRLSSASTYLSIDELLSIVKEHQIDAIHPGYGFLSESAEFARRAWKEANAVVIGPGWDILDRTGDKLQARRLAKACGVPILEATEYPMSDLEDIQQYINHVGLPVMLKAVDGGGGRGIRLVVNERNLENMVKRAMEESPSKQIFVEKAAIDGFRHIEVQVVGDGVSKAEHLWERECSIQRRYQKIIEVAPSTISDRRLVSKIIEAALRMANEIRYFSLGTFEFLCNPSTSEFFFLEVNPRLQVEHTVTESITFLDIVKIQLQLAQGAPLRSTAVGRCSRNPEAPPPLSSIQLRLTAESVENDWSLSIGKIRSFRFPTGNGIRIDTHLINGHPTVVTADFDSLLAKIIVTAATWEDAVRKARRALLDIDIKGVKTNIDVLRGVISTQAFEKGECDTRWLEANLAGILENGQQLLPATRDSFFTQSPSSETSQNLANSNILFRKGDAWSLKLTPASNPGLTATSPLSVTHHLKLDKVTRNDFPSTFVADILYTTPKSETPEPYKLELASTSASSSALMAAGKHRRGDVADPHHVVIPFPGKLIEVLVDEGDVVQAEDVILVVRQMKMELEVRTSRGGRIKWLTEVEDGEDVADGMLAAELEDLEAPLEPRTLAKL